MADTEIFHCSVVTPEAAVLECEAKYVAFPAYDGEIGVLKNRSPLLCRLGIGPMRVETEEGIKVLFIDGGFAQMVDNRLTILTEQTREPSEIDHSEALKGLESARTMTATDDASFEERQKSLKRARAQVKLAEANRDN